MDEHGRLSHRDLHWRHRTARRAGKSARAIPSRWRWPGFDPATAAAARSAARCAVSQYAGTAMTVCLLSGQSVGTQLVLKHYSSMTEVVLLAVP